MKIRFLGTGTSTGTPEIGCNCPVCTSVNKKDKRFRSSVLINVKCKYILIDCGPDFYAQMLETFKVETIKQLDGVLITHEHYDHVGGIDDLRCFTKKKQVVNIYTGNNVSLKLIKRLPYIFADYDYYPGIPNLKINSIQKDKPFYISGVKIIPINLLHGKKLILGYRIDKFAYLTDLKTIPDTEFKKLTGLSVLVINALREKYHDTHANIKEALKYIDIIKPERAFITHVCHDFGLHENVQKTLPKNILIAYDGLEIFF
ncbi:MAG: MBL fold metallo-hydrolase [Bacteroidales bacterium OttesenSCG-928-I14]|nr:MBL fold metallo-hydrolase [Bacteroidales bacterium OttesenSCG-928-I14]